MIPEQKLMAIYGGGMAVAIIIGWIILDSQASTIEVNAAQAAELRKKYSDYYPDEGIPVTDAIKRWAKVAKDQGATLAEAEAGLMPELPNGYVSLELGNDQRQQKDDITHIRQRAETQGLKLPGSLPMESVLDERNPVRGMQMMELYLFRKTIDACMDDGVSKFNGMKMLVPVADPSEKYALFQMEVKMDAGFEKADGLLLDMVQRQSHEGFGIRALTMGYDNKSDKIAMTVTFSMLVHNNPDWNLKFNTSLEQGSGQQNPGKNRFNSK